jgi:hypothetical protein
VTKVSDDQVQGSLFGVSCPTTSLCVAVGSDGLIATSTNPTGGRAAWSVVHPGGTEDIGPIEGKGIIFPGAQIRGISCPSAEFCVGASLQGRFFSSHNPAGGAAAWKITPLGGEKEAHIHMTGVSCPSTTFCVAVAYGSKVISSTDPDGDTSAWSVVELSQPLDLRGISCPSTTLCVAVDNEGKIVYSTDPTGPASAWSAAVAPAGISSLNGISCPSVSLCVTGNAGQMITSTNPAGGAWNTATAGTGLPVKGVSCPLVSACAAVDNNSDVIVSTNPTGGSGAWSYTNVIPYFEAPNGGPNGMFGLSCPTTSLCVGVGQYEQIITSTDPFTPEPVKVPVHKSKRPIAVITRHPGKRVNPRRGGVKVTFRFHALGSAARFKCKISGRKLRTCKSPMHYRLGRGKQVFSVRAIAPGGVKGPPAVFHFRVGRLMQREPVGSCHSGGPQRPCINA